MAKRYLLNKKFWKIKTWIYDVARLTAAWKNYGAPVEKLCWSCLSPTLKMCTLVLAKSFALFLAKNFAPQFLPSWIALSSHFPLPKTLHLSKQFAFFALSNGVTDHDRGLKQQSKRSNFRLHRSSFSPKISKKWIKLVPKLLEIEEDIVREVARLGNKHHLRKSADRNAQIRSVSGTNAFLICVFRSADFSGGVYSPSATSRTISFSISNSFWYKIAGRCGAPQASYDRRPRRPPITPKLLSDWTSASISEK